MQCTALKPEIMPLLLTLNEERREAKEGVKKETTKAASSTLPVAQSASSGSTMICVLDSIADEEVPSASTPLGCGLKLRAKKRKMQDSSSQRCR